jgi:curli biogenesis system outer membrane secretion channel CsgG
VKNIGLLVVFFVSALFVGKLVLAQEPVNSNTSAVIADKPIIGVLKFQDETGAMFLQGGVGRALTTMLTNELSARPSLTIVERQKLRAVLEEQNLSASGMVSAATSIEIGKLTGAQYLITGTITAFENQVETKTKRGFMGYGGGVESISHGGYMAVDLRVVDTTTGEIRYSRTIEGRTAPAGNNDIQTQRSGGIAGVDTGPDSRAVRAAVIEIVDYLECAMVKRDTCIAEFELKEKNRVARTRQSIKIK